MKEMVHERGSRENLNLKIKVAPVSKHHVTDTHGKVKRT
jgi:hypothetical protein